MRTPLMLFLSISFLTLLLSLTSCQKEISLDKRDSWIQIIRSPFEAKPILILEHKESYRIDTFFQSQDTLYNTINPDSIGIVSLITPDGRPLFAFRVTPQVELSFEYKKDTLIFKSNDSLNICLAKYYKEERQWVRSFNRFADSLKLKKVSADSLSVLWLRKHSVEDSLWQEKALSFLRANPTDLVGILPAQSYLLRVDNSPFRVALQPLVNELPDYRLIKIIAVHE